MESTNKLLSLVDKECQTYSIKGNDYNRALSSALGKIIQRERKAYIAAGSIQNDIDKECRALGECLFKILEDELGETQSMND